MVDPVRRMLKKEEPYCSSCDVPMRYLGVKKVYGENVHAFNCKECRKRTPGGGNTVHGVLSLDEY